MPDTLIACWQDALTHPGMEAQFASPIGFAVAQMQGDAAALPVILTRDDRNCGGRAALLEIQKQIAALHLPLQFAPIRLAVAAADAPARGMTLADFAPTSDIAQEYRRTAEPILHFLEATQ